MFKKSDKINSITQAIKFITGILSWVALVILLIIAGFLLYYFISTKIYAQKGEDYKPAVGLYTILTPSMTPNIKPYDVIVDVVVDEPSDIEIGDVITFVSSASLTKGMVITHRVVNIKEENGNLVYYTKGDNNLSPDGAPAQFKNVLGKVLFKIPKLGYLQRFLATKLGWLIVVVIPAVCVIISDILKIFRLQDAKNKIEENSKKEALAKEKYEKQKKEIENELAERYERKRIEKESKNTSSSDLPKVKKRHDDKQE